MASVRTSSGLPVRITPARRHRSGVRAAVRLALCLLAAGFAVPASAQAPDRSNAVIVGAIEYLTILDPADPWSGGLIGVGGSDIIIPRNLLIDLPANRLTLKDLFDQAPKGCDTFGESGLAAKDRCLDVRGMSPGVATILANRTLAGDLIAGDVFIEKGQETVSGIVSFIDYRHGFLEVNGVTGQQGTGVMLRINDPEGVHTLQFGPGCAGAASGTNCSPDTRFGLDPENYTITFTTGYPACIPSQVFIGRRDGYRVDDGDKFQGADVFGAGDPFCPQTNRPGKPVPDSTLYAPIQLGDHITAEGNFEIFGDLAFLSAHTLMISSALTTQNLPTQPDYMIWDEVEWDVPSFANQRVRMLLIGFTTVENETEVAVDVFALHKDPLTNTDVEYPLASTVGNPDTHVAVGINGSPGIFKIRYDVDFGLGTQPKTSPCLHLTNAGYAVCPLGGTMAEEFALVSPISRELIGRSRHKATLLPGVATRDINGAIAANGEYLTPVGVGHPEFVEVDLDMLDTPFVFSGLPWNMDRRLGPGGCKDVDGDGVVDCEAGSMPLDPFPFGGIDPESESLYPLGAQHRTLSHHPFGLTDWLVWPPLDPPQQD